MACEQVECQFTRVKKDRESGIRKWMEATMMENIVSAEWLSVVITLFYFSGLIDTTPCLCLSFTLSHIPNSISLLSNVSS